MDAEARSAKVLQEAGDVRGTLISTASAAQAVSSDLLFCAVPSASFARLGREPCSTSALRLCDILARSIAMVLPRSFIASIVVGVSFRTTFSAPITNPSDGNPVSSTDSAVIPTSSYDLVTGQTAETDYGFYLDFDSTANPQPIRGSQGATDPGPRNYNYDKINSDLFALPATIALAFRVLDGPPAKRCRPPYRDRYGGPRHAPFPQRVPRIAVAFRKRVTFIDDLNTGDVWFLPAGLPQSIQALDQGVEFLLVFDQGSFSEEDTNLVFELFLRNPPPSSPRIIRLTSPPSTPSPPASYTSSLQCRPQRKFPRRTSLAQPQAPYTVPGGSIKILDPTTFPIASMFSVALVTVAPGAMRELHWHLNSDEWSFFLQGSARITVFAAPESSRTFNFQAGDVAHIFVPQSHYIENTGSEDVIYLEVLQAPKFTGEFSLYAIDISVAQWLGLTPPQVVNDTLYLPDAVIASLPKYKQYPVPGSTNATETNFTVVG
ncbi:hypothetical protein MMC18_006285 [Xylographa bjoerkii]|nr:hypothetical protein [Xylographa bjoerkii]